jgi:molybdopterin molybdotransferase
MSLFDLLQVIDRQVRPVETEEVPLIEAYGRVAAKALSSGRDMPPFDVSALDGYALKGPGPRFVVKGLLEPLCEAAYDLGEGEALFVPTGGPFPEGSRFVAREHVTELGEAVAAGTGRDERKSVRKGDWLRTGQRLIEKGRVVGPAAMALLALAGYETLQVYKRPSVAIVTTGSELKKGRIADSNRFLLAGLVQRDGGAVVGLATADDEEGQIEEDLMRASGARLLILTGGTSTGKKDLTKQVVKRLGYGFSLESPPIIPGKTMSFGRKGEACFFILPGNPKAVRSLYELFVRRALLRMAGLRSEEKEYRLPVPEEIEKAGDKVMIVPVLVTSRPAAIEQMYPEEPNGFVVLEEGVERVEAGETVRVLGL